MLFLAYVREKQGDKRVRNGNVQVHLHFHLYMSFEISLGSVYLHRLKKHTLCLHLFCFITLQVSRIHLRVCILHIFYTYSTYNDLQFGLWSA